MNNNGVSKKLCITAMAMGLIMTMSDGAEDKLPYAIVIGSICIIYKIVQGFLDWRKKD